MSEVLSKATAALFRKMASSTFFTMLAFSQILNIYLQWLAVLGLAKKQKNKKRQLTVPHLVDVRMTWAPRRCLLIPYRLSNMARFDCQSAGAEGGAQV